MPVLQASSKTKTVQKEKEITQLRTIPKNLHLKSDNACKSTGKGCYATDVVTYEMDSCHCQW